MQYSFVKICSNEVYVYVSQISYTLPALCSKLWFTASGKVFLPLATALATTKNVEVFLPTATASAMAKKSEVFQPTATASATAKNITYGRPLTIITKVQVIQCSCTRCTRTQQRPNRNEIPLFRNTIGVQ